MPKGPQWKTKTEPSSSLQPIYEYGIILDIDNTQDLRKTIENWEQSDIRFQKLNFYTLNGFTL